MQKYAVFMLASISVEVEADSREDAAEKAADVNLFVDDDRIDVVFVDREEIFELDKDGNIIKE